MFGNWIPFIGFRAIYVDDDGYPSEHATRWKADGFTVEWLNRGVVLFVCGVEEA